MGIQFHALTQEIETSPAKQNPNNVESSLDRGLGQPAIVQPRNKEIVDASLDQISWHVNSRVICGGPGRSSGSESFFPMRPSFVCKRPEPYTILNLRSDGQSRWSSPLPANFASLDIRISSSKSFNDEAGTRYGGYMRGDIQDCITRDDYEAAVAGKGAEDSPVELEHTSVTPQGARITFEYIFEHVGGTQRWALMDVVVVIKGVAARM